MSTGGKTVEGSSEAVCLDVYLLHFNAQGVCEIWQGLGGADVFGYVHASVCVLTEGKQRERQRMNMLYDSSKILHGPSAWEEPRAECLWLPNIINYPCAFTSSCCVWPAMSFCGRMGYWMVCLFMNTNYTCVSLSLNVYLPFPAAARTLVKSGVLRSDFMWWISTGTASKLVC